MKVIALINAKAGSLASTPNLDQTEHIREAFSAERMTADYLRVYAKAAS